MVRNNAQYYRIRVSEGLFGSFTYLGSYEMGSYERVFALSHDGALIRYLKKQGVKSQTVHTCIEKWAKYQVSEESKKGCRRHYQYYV